MYDIMGNNSISKDFKLFFIHGYESSPDGTKAVLFSNTLNAKPIKYRDCEPQELVVSDCLKRISDEIKNVKNVVLIGSSLGGFLAVETAVYNLNVKSLILLNPALIPPYVDIKNISGMPIDILRDMKDERLFSKKLSAQICIIAGTDDEIVPNDWVIEFAKAQESTIKFLKDDHRFVKNIENLPDIIKKLLI